MDEGHHLLVIVDELAPDRLAAEPVIDQEPAAQIAPLLAGMDHVDERPSFAVAGQRPGEPGLMVAGRNSPIAGEIQRRHELAPPNPPIPIHVRHVAHDQIPGDDGQFVAIVD
ncbi:hypothetical protein AVT10_00305 [Sphingomonas hankookensis]|uniref:Uncharacterized protein n=1 Tax=Sphingomonas hankookensis TaxID=563996 RepID=A0ABR5YH27_9SPHN|nr:hypothetical protein AVT10_00305 [Sphingomonas hankookensis]